MEAAEVGGSQTVGLSLEGPREVRRVTVGFRIILAVPHFLFLGALSLVAMFASVAAWFAALFTGKMPDGIGDFLGNIVQYSTRVYGYVYLLTDTYPPFSLDTPDYPITVLLPPRGRLNRAAVLFRLILAVPAFFVVSLVGGGLQLALFIIWLIVLISGRMPTSAFEALSVSLRYQTRVYCWLLMLSSEYPKGVFGDSPSPAGSALNAPGAPGADLSEFVVSTLPSPPPPPPSAAVSSLPDPTAPGAFPRITRLVLSRGGKRLTVVFIVVGSVVLVGQIALSLLVGSQSSEALRHLNADYRDLGRASQTYGVAVRDCGLSPQPDGLACEQEADRHFAEAARRFRAEIEAEELPSHALATADDVRDDLTRLIDLLDQMVATSDVGAYRTLFGQLPALATDVDNGYADLHDELLFSY